MRFDAVPLTVLGKVGRVPLVFAAYGFSSQTVCARSHVQYFRPRLHVTKAVDLYQMPELSVEPPDPFVPCVSVWGRGVGRREAEGNFMGLSRGTDAGRGTREPRPESSDIRAHTYCTSESSGLAFSSRRSCSYASLF